MRKKTTLPLQPKAHRRFFAAWRFGNSKGLTPKERTSKKFSLLFRGDNCPTDKKGPYWRNIIAKPNTLAVRAAGLGWSNISPVRRPQNTTHNPYLHGGRQWSDLAACPAYSTLKRRIGRLGAIRAGVMKDINFYWRILPAIRQRAWLTGQGQRGTWMTSLALCNANRGIWRNALPRGSWGLLPSTSHRASPEGADKNQITHFSLPLFPHPKPESFYSKRTPLAAICLLNAFQHLLYKQHGLC